MTDWQPAPQTPTGPAPRGHFGLRLGAMTLADIVDNSIKLFKQNWRQIALVVLILSIPTMVLGVVVKATGGVTVTDVFQNFSNALENNTEVPQEQISVADGVSTAVAALIYIFVQPFVTGVITRMVAASYLGQKLTAQESASGLLRKWPALIGASVLTGLTIFGAFMVMAVPIVALGAAVSAAFFALFLFTIPPIVALVVLLSAAVPAIAVEETGPARALNRSWALMRRRFWPYLGTLIVMGIIVVIGSQVVDSLLVGLQVLAENLFDPLAYVVIVVRDFASNVIMLPVLAIASTLIYFDARIRFEGFDLQMMMSRLPSAEAQSEAPKQL